MWRTTWNARDLWNSPPFRISYSHNTDDQRRAHAARAQPDRDHPNEASRIRESLRGRRGTGVASPRRLCRRLPRGRIRAPRHGNQVRWPPWERSACAQEPTNARRRGHNPVSTTSQRQEASSQSPSFGVHFVLTKTQIGKHKPVARHDFSNLYRKVVPEHRACIDECVEFPVLATGVDLWRQVRKQLFIKFPASKFGC